MAEKGIVKTDKFEMEYFKFGSGDKCLVMVPGLCIQSVIGNREAVEGACKIYANDFTVYVFDRRMSIPEDYSIYDMADDTAAAIKKLGLKDVNLFGASQGGMISLVIAIRYPELVKKLVLASTSSHIQDGQSAVIDRWIRLAEEKDRIGLYQEYGREIYPKDIYEQFKDFFTEAAATVTDEELQRFVILAKAIRNFDVSKELNKVNCPVFVMGVFEDSVLDSDATLEIAENLDYRDDFALYLYKGYGHAAFDTAPDYKKKVYEFLMK